MFVRRFSRRKAFEAAGLGAIGLTAEGALLRLVTGEAGTLPVETWVLVSARTPAQVPNTLPSVLNHPGIVGVSLAQGWDQIELTEGTFDFSTQQTVLDICRASGKKFSARFRGGSHTPSWNMGRTWVPARGQAAGLPLPCPFGADGSVNTVYLSAYRRYVWAQRRYLVTQLAVGDILHMTQWGGVSAELYAPTLATYDDSITKLDGFTQQVVNDAHVALVISAQKAQGTGVWDIEFPIGGFAPATLKQTIVAQLATRARAYLQMNGLTDSTTSSGITNWPYGVNPAHGLQMIHEGDYDWPQVYANAKLSGALYVEVYLKSFQSTGAPGLYAAAEAASIP